jgi:hypothetical protein
MVGEFVAHDSSSRSCASSQSIRRNAFGRYPLKSGLVMLVLSSSGFDPGCVKTTSRVMIRLTISGGDR